MPSFRWRSCARPRPRRRQWAPYATPICVCFFFKQAPVATCYTCHMLRCHMCNSLSIVATLPLLTTNNIPEDWDSKWNWESLGATRLPLGWLSIACQLPVVGCCVATTVSVNLLATHRFFIMAQASLKLTKLLSWRHQRHLSQRIWSCFTSFLLVCCVDVSNTRLNIPFPKLLGCF